MTVPDTSVKYYNSGFTDAPSVTNVYGNLTSFLDAVLVNGFGLKVVNSLTYDPATQLVKATITSGHSFALNQVIKIEGASPANYNGEFRVVSKTNSELTYKAEGITTNVATASPAISCKSAPLGYEIVYTRDYKRCYRSKNATSNGNMLVVYDGPKDTPYGSTWAKWANVGIVESMSDVDTITGAQAPYDMNNPTQNWQSVASNQYGWFKWYFARQGGYDNYGDGGSGNRNWVIVGDDKMFYLFITNESGFNWYGRNFYSFGEINSFKPGDQFGTVLNASNVYSSTTTYWNYPGQSNGYGLVLSLDGNGKVLLRDHTQLGGHTGWSVTSLNTNNSQQVSGRGGIPFPNSSDYSLWLMPMYCRQSDGSMRGMMPGVLWIPQDTPYADQTVVDNVVGQEGRRFLLVRTQYSSETEGAQVAFDLTGPWR